MLLLLQAGPTSPAGRNHFPQVLELGPPPVRCDLGEVTCTPPPRVGGTTGMPGAASSLLGSGGRRGSERMKAVEASTDNL